MVTRSGYTLGITAFELVEFNGKRVRAALSQKVMNSILDDR